MPAKPASWGERKRRNESVLEFGDIYFDGWARHTRPPIGGRPAAENKRGAASPGRNPIDIDEDELTYCLPDRRTIVAQPVHQTSRHVRPDAGQAGFVADRTRRNESLLEFGDDLFRWLGSPHAAAHRAAVRPLRTSAVPRPRVPRVKSGDSNPDPTTHRRAFACPPASRRRSRDTYMPRPRVLPREIRAICRLPD